MLKIVYDGMANMQLRNFVYQFSLHVFFFLRSISLTADDEFNIRKRFYKFHSKNHYRSTVFFKETRVQVEKSSRRIAAFYILTLTYSGKSILTIRARCTRDCIT